MATPAEQIKERLNIADVIGGYVKLEKAGANFRTRCPFHNEKTPSFFISPARQSYHCFGCNRGGDIFTFVQEIEGLDFLEALKLLANRAGVVLETRSFTPDALQGEKEYLKRVLEVATRYYEKRLTESKEVNTYLLRRGLTPETFTTFRIGFAPDGWRNLVEFCAGQGIKKEMLEKAGLAVRSSKSPTEIYDRFRGRIMFPIADREGTVVGFSGRVFDVDGKKAEEAKYVNTPQTLLYDKSRVLYGYHLAKTAIRQTDTCILVEGQMDLVMSHQALRPQTVAVSGTALTEWHLTAIKRIASRLVMAFDADTAGVNASKRALQMALALGFEVKIAKLAPGLDPADVVKDNPETWQVAVDEAVHVIDFYLEAVSQKFPGDVRAQGAVIREDVYPLVAVLAQKIDQAYFIRKIAELLHVSEDIIWQDIRDYVSNMKSPVSNSNYVKAVGSEPSLVAPGRLSLVEGRLLGILWWHEEKPDYAKIAKDFRHQAVTIFSKDRLNNLEQDFVGKKDSLLLEIDILYDGKDLTTEFTELLNEWQELTLRQELTKTMDLLKLAESQKDANSIDKYMKKCQDISQAIRELTSKKHHAK